MASSNDTSANPAASPPPGQLQPVTLYNNYISLFGFALVALGIFLLLTFGLFQMLVPSANPYVGIIGFMVLPGILVTGLFVVPVGMLLKLRQVHRHAKTEVGTFRLPPIDLNHPRTRRSILIFVAVSVCLILPILSVASYSGYHFTESSQFCGRTCHTVMEPEATAHATSPHARVSCAECHIGGGASWFVKSKLSGTRQVLAVWENSYPRPIPPAITQLRPARETCEECHWPAKFYGSQLKEIVHFSPDENNARRMVRMLLKVGGADESIGRVEGIHMHMVLVGRVEYVATDDILQDIPWVKYVDAKGVEHVYRSDGKPVTDPPPEGLLRKVDCMDCHNRGAHHFRSPQVAVDLFLNVGRVDPALPYIKREAVAALSATYADVPEAQTGVERALTSFYQEQYPAVWLNQQVAVRQAVDMLKEVYSQSFFPAMHVNWMTYPENIGHLTSAGCFRCHDGLHVDGAGGHISSDCHTCHTFLNPIEGREGAFEEGEFQHSMNLVKHGKLQCMQCHTGGPLPLCGECHGSGTWLETWGKGRFKGEDTQHWAVPLSPGPGSTPSTQAASNGECAGPLVVSNRAR